MKRNARSLRRYARKIRPMIEAAERRRLKRLQTGRGIAGDVS